MTNRGRGYRSIIKCVLLRMGCALVQYLTIKFIEAILCCL